LLGLAPAGAALAQPAHADLTLSWFEVIAGSTTAVSSPNGILEPGEAARLRVSIAFTPVGTLVGSSTGPAPVAGFYRTGFDLDLVSGQGGIWNRFNATPG